MEGKCCKTCREPGLRQRQSRDCRGFCCSFIMGVSISVCGDGITESANLPVPRSSLAVAPCGLRCAYILWRNLGWILRAESIAPAGFDARTERTQCSQQPHQTYPLPCTGCLQAPVMRQACCSVASCGILHPAQQPWVGSSRNVWFFGDQVFFS